MFRNTSVEVDRRCFAAALEAETEANTVYAPGVAALHRGGSDTSEYRPRRKSQKPGFGAEAASAGVNLAGWRRCYVAGTGDGHPQAMHTPTVSSPVRRSACWHCSLCHS